MQKRALWAAGLSTVWMVLWCTLVWRLFDQNAHFASGLYAPLMGFISIIASILRLSLPSAPEVSEILVPFAVFWIIEIFLVALSLLPNAPPETEEHHTEKKPPES